MATLELIEKKIFIDGKPINDFHIEAIFKKALPGIKVTFTQDDDEFAVCEMNGKKVNIANMIFLKEGEFETIADWEKGVRKTIKYLATKLVPYTIESKKTDLL